MFQSVLQEQSILILNCCHICILIILKKNNSLAELLMKVIKNKSTLLSLRTIVSWLFTIWHLLICFPLIQCYSVCIILHEQNMSVSLWYYLQLKHNIILVQYVDPAETIPPKLQAST